MAFLSPDPVTMYLSSTDMSQLNTEEDSLDWEKKQEKRESHYYQTQKFLITSEIKSICRYVKWYLHINTMYFVKSIIHINDDVS